MTIANDVVPEGPSPSGDFIDQAIGEAELRSIYRQLGKFLNSRGESSAFRFRQPRQIENDPEILACFADFLHRLRAKRSSFLPKGLFGEPGWDILLDLYAQKHRGQQAYVTSLCAGSGVPPTTALRWIAEMEGHGLIWRKPDPKDHRRYFVYLTKETERAMQHTLGVMFKSLRGLFERG